MPEAELEAVAKEVAEPGSGEAEPAGVDEPSARLADAAAEYVADPLPSADALSAPLALPEAALEALPASADAVAAPGDAEPTAALALAAALSVPLALPAALRLPVVLAPPLAEAQGEALAAALALPLPEADAAAPVAVGAGAVGEGEPAADAVALADAAPCEGEPPPPAEREALRDAAGCEGEPEGEPVRAGDAVGEALAGKVSLAECDMLPLTDAQRETGAEGVAADAEPDAEGPGIDALAAALVEGVIVAHGESRPDALLSAVCVAPARLGELLPL